MARGRVRYVECPFCRTGGLSVGIDETEGQCPMCGERFTIDKRGITQIKGTGWEGGALILFLLLLPVVLIGCLITL